MHGTRIGLHTPLTPENAAVENIRPLDRQNNFSQLNFFTLPGQGVATDRSAGGKHEPASDKLLKYFCEKTVRDPPREAAMSRRSIVVPNGFLPRASSPSIAYSLSRPSFILAVEGSKDQFSPLNEKQDCKIHTR